jgi:DNA-binding transcriptional ArsR family regulator
MSSELVSRGTQDADPGPASDDPGATDGSVDCEELLSLLGDEHAREIVSLVAEEPLAAREIVDHLDVSRATVYRRLNRLTDAGLVEVSLSVHPDGHHRKRFRVSREEFLLTFDDGVSMGRPSAGREWS